MRRFTQIVLLLAVSLAVHPACPRADDRVPPLPDRNPMRPGAAALKPVLPGDAPTVAWTDAEIEAAKEECRGALGGLAIEYKDLPPIREGLCGAPAPILVSSIGSDPKVAIEPPATMRCPLAKALVGWLKDTVQPKAKADLGATVVKLHNATSYACRNRYGGPNTPISEHALANAFDISEFVLDSGEKITVLTAWPQTVAQAPAAAPSPAPDSGSANASGARPKLTAADRVAADTEAKVTKAKSVEPPSAEVEKPEPPKPELDARAKFVRAVHDEACKTFGTVLGPAANAAHKDHFHFDMKERHSPYCDNGSIRKP